jgi:hypothetical protein
MTKLSREAACTGATLMRAVKEHGEVEVGPGYVARAPRKLFSSSTIVVRDPKGRGILSGYPRTCAAFFKGVFSLQDQERKDGQ